MSEKLFYKTSGKGQKLVLLHGFCESSEIWWKLDPHLTDRYQLLMPDLPGFGKSTQSVDNISIERAADKVEEWLIDVAQDEKIIVIGHSLGGYVALALASKYPKRLLGAGLLNSTAYPDNDEKKESRLKVVEFIKRNGKEAFLDSFVPSLFYEDRMAENKSEIEKVKSITSHTSEQAMIAYTLAMRERDSGIEILRDHSLPILFIGGKEDQLISAEVSLKQMALLGNEYAHLIPRCGHMAMIEEPVKTSSLINKFMEHISA